MRYIVIALILVSTAVSAFSIKERTDDFSKQTYLHASDLKVCQPKNAGFAASCATLDLLWNKEDPDVVLVRVELQEIASVTDLSVRIAGEIQTYSASAPSTKISYRDRMVSALAWSSANTFVIPVSAIKAIAESKDSGIVRVTGLHHTTDFDFYRKAKMSGLPRDELRQFLDAINR